jgi:formylglycine-generating enzyme required for sulfatase activity
MNRHIGKLSKYTEDILCSPFEWCYVEGGKVMLENAAEYGGTKGGIYQVENYAIAKYPITNAQYDKFLKHADGFSNPKWWGYSAEAIQWRKDRKNPKPTAFEGDDLPRTRASWFDSMAFCKWLSTELKNSMQSDSAEKLSCQVRLPTEQEWQRAALGNTEWCYPWGNQLDEMYANYGGNIGQPSDVQNYPFGKSIYGAIDMIGNVWEWCVTGWNQEEIDVNGYTYRIIRGGAWNKTDPNHLRANDRGYTPPRGRLNDCGFRIALICD